LAEKEKSEPKSALRVKKTIKETVWPLTGDRKGKRTGEKKPKSANPKQLGEKTRQLWFEKKKKFFNKILEKDKKVQWACQRKRRVRERRLKMGLGCGER